LPGENDETQQNLCHANFLSICTEFANFERKWHHVSGQKTLIVGWQQCFILLHKLYVVTIKQVTLE
jgi:hypothetical protein